MEKAKYKIGDIIYVKSEHDKQKILQGVIYAAEYTYNWFYWIKAIDPTGGDNQKEDIYSYEIDTGDAKTKIINLI